MVADCATINAIHGIAKSGTVIVVRALKQPSNLSAGRPLGLNSIKRLKAHQSYREWLSDRPVATRKLPDHIPDAGRARFNRTEQTQNIVPFSPHTIVVLRITVSR